MDYEFFFKSLKLRYIPKEQAEELSSKITEIVTGISAKTIFDPENTLAQLYDKLKKQSLKEGKKEKQLKEAEQMIMAIAHLTHNRVAGVAVEARGKRSGRGFKHTDLVVEQEITIPSPAQAKKKLQEGQERFLTGKREYESKHGRLEVPKQYDVVILTCSDARNVFSLSQDFIDQNVLVVQVAGNVYSKKAKERKTIRDALSRLKEGGTVMVVGHKFCGAVAAKEHAEAYQEDLPKIGSLIEDVDIEHTASSHKNHEANVVTQADRLRADKIVKSKNLQIIPCVFDFTASGDECLSYLGEGKEPDIINDFRTSAVSRISSARAEGKDLSRQQVHSIIVCDPVDLGRFTDPRTVFDAGLNDVFSVSVNGQEIDTNAIASIEYALSFVDIVKHNGNIVILASSKSIADELEKQMKLESTIINSKGNISIALYNRETGEVSFI